jgi:putative ubiquitin-RnfH superfamily antitoxin RatB of RatAB toxin-antitoxin module
MKSKQVTVAYALPERQWLWVLELPVAATIADALVSARAQVGATAAVPWDLAPVAIFGELTTRSAIPRDGDRIELLRPLAVDPKESRRARAQRLRAARSGAKG